MSGAQHADRAARWKQQGRTLAAETVIDRQSTVDVDVGVETAPSAGAQLVTGKRSGVHGIGGAEGSKGQRGRNKRMASHLDRVAGGYDSPWKVADSAPRRSAGMKITAPVVG